MATHNHNRSRDQLRVRKPGGSVLRIGDGGLVSGTTIDVTGGLSVKFEEELVRASVNEGIGRFADCRNDDGSIAEL